MIYLYMAIRNSILNGITYYSLQKELLILNQKFFFKVHIFHILLYIKFKKFLKNFFKNIETFISLV